MLEISRMHLAVTQVHGDQYMHHMALATLPAELLRIIISVLLRARDARQLERLGATCKALLAISREEAPWRVLLMAHFDIDTPDAVPIVVIVARALGGQPAINPRLHLIAHVKMAQQLTREYAEHEESNLPFAHFGIQHMNAPEQVKQWVGTRAAPADEYMDWLVSLANRIQLARGGPPISGAEERGQFLNSALYRHLNQIGSCASALVSYGHYMRLTVVNKYALNALGCTDEEASISTWLQWNKDYANVDRVEDEPDFLVMQNWTRRKLNDIARPQYLVMVDELRAFVRKHDLGGENVVRRMLAVQRDGGYQPIDYQPIQEDGGELPHTYRIIPSLCERPIATTKLLAGLHGGLFVYDQTFDPEGSHFRSSLFCLADRDAVIHEVEADEFGH